MRFAEFNEKAFDTLPELPAADVRIMWADDWCDYAVQGIASVEGRHVWFLLHDADALIVTGGELRYVLVELTAEQVRENAHWHGLFCKYVGTLYDFTGRERVRHPQAQWSKFYEASARRVVPDYSSNQVIGWCRNFQWPHNSPLQPTGVTGG